MKSQFHALARGITRLDQTLAGKKAASLEAWVFLGPVFLFFTWIAFRESLAVAPERLLAIDFFSQLLTFASYVLTRGFVANRKGTNSAKKLLTWYMLVSLPSELLKDFLLGISTEWRPDRPVLWLVVPTSCMIAAIWIALANLAVNWFAAARDSLGELRGVEATLIDSRSKLSSLLAAELESLRAQVQSVLVPEIENLREKLRSKNYLEDSALLSAAAQIRGFCDSEVRELGREIATRRERAIQTKVSRSLGVLPALKIVVQSGENSLTRIYVVMLSLAIPYAMNASGYQAVFVTAVGLTLGFFVLIPVEKRRRRLFAGSTWANITSSFVMYASISLVGVGVLHAGLPLYRSLGSYIESLWFLLPGILVFVWAVLGFVFGANQVLTATLNLLAQTNAQLITENDRLQAEAGVARKRLYRLLHGAVQGRLAAVSLALTALVAEPGEARRQELLNQAIEQIGLAERDLKNAFVESDLSSPFRDRIAEVVAAWRNLLAIEVVMSDVAVRLLNENWSLADAILSAAQEGITNAHRHAQARNVLLQLECGSDETLILRLVNDVHENQKSFEELRQGTGLGQIAVDAADLKFTAFEDRVELVAAWKVPKNR